MSISSLFPSRIGRYDVLRLLGQGGMGRVALARDPVLERKVAIKILRDDLGLPPDMRNALLDRMRHEARAAAALSHPNMVTIFDMGEAGELGLYLVFEYVDGPTLREHLQGGGSLSPAEAAKLAREVGDALTHAHQAGVIHRDVKPENVLLSTTGSKLTDFGIARLPDSTLTRAGSMLGTPAYSAPEALSKSAFGAASDQFSLAVTLYEALTGRRAFPGDDAIAVAGQIANQAPPPLVSFWSSSPPWLAADRILSRAMAKVPSHRFASCREFGEAFANALEGQGLERFSPESSSRPPSSFLSGATRRVHNLVAVVGLFVIIGLLVMDRWNRNPPGLSLRDVAKSYASALAVASPPALRVKPVVSKDAAFVPAASVAPTAAKNDGGSVSDGSAAF